VFFLALALAAVFGFWLRFFFFVLSHGGGFLQKRRGISCVGFWTLHVHIPACDRPAVFSFSFSLMIDSGREVNRNLVTVL
jgi:hypothetical protein